MDSCLESTIGAWLADTLILALISDSDPPELEENKLCCFKLLSLKSFVIVATENWYIAYKEA